MDRRLVVVLLVASCMLHASARDAPSGKRETTSSSGVVSASSCSFAGASATDGSASSHAASSSAALVGASKACADAAVKAIEDSCYGNNAIAAVSTAAAACASAFAKVYVKTVGYSKAAGNSQACSASCASGNGYAKATAEAIAKAYAKAKNPCAAVEAELKSSAFVEALAAAYAKAYSKTCADARGGKATASTVAEGWLTVTASAVAKSLGNVIAISCSKCGGCKCQGGVKYEAESNTDVYSEVVGGTYALTKAVADAGAIYCTGKGSSESSKVAISTYLKAYADICVKVYGKLYASSLSSGHGSFACSGVFGQYKAVSEALAKVVAKAWANNYDGFCSEVYAYVEGSALVKDAAKVVGEAHTSACSSNGSPTSSSTRDIYEYITKYQPFSEALQQAYSTATNHCPCPSPYLCCSTCDLTKTCPAYKDK